MNLMIFFDDYSRYLNNKPKSKLCFKEITVEVTLTIINDLKPKSSSGIDEISNKTLKYLKNEIAAPLTIIINQMLHSGIFPDALNCQKLFHSIKKMTSSCFQIIDPFLYCHQYKNFSKKSSCYNLLNIETRTTYCTKISMDLRKITLLK